ncbi:MAG: site-2 protease family protein [Anaerolineales bacterium]|jgi:Zn-dependent protease
MTAQVGIPGDITQLTALIGRVMSIEDTTAGTPRDPYVLRARGRLLLDSAEAYDRLAESLRPLNLTPLFRMEGDKHVVILSPGTFQTRPSNIWVNVVLFGLTVLSVLFVGASMNATAATPAGQTATGSLLTNLQYLLSNLASGLPFAASLLAILGVHEFGHYLAGRYHRTAVTLPYFIPMPFSYFGTLGAFISMKEPPRNRRVLLDIAIAGPLAGLVVAIPILLYGLSTSSLGTLPLHASATTSYILEGNSLLYLISKWLVFGRLLPSPAHYTLAPLLYWLRYLVLGQPIPAGGTDVLLGPVAWAGWAGLLVTGLNLIPASQLDGGHLLYVLIGKRTNRVLPVILVVLVVLGFIWPGWFIWALLILLFGRSHAEPLDQITTLDNRRKLLAIAGLIIFLLVFTPVPLVAVGG